jgi:hypothetical protein
MMHLGMQWLENNQAHNMDQHGNNPVPPSPQQLTGTPAGDPSKSSKGTPMVSVDSETDDDYQGATTFEVSSALTVLNFNSSSRNSPQDEFINGRTIARKLKQKLYKRIMEDIARPKLKADDDEYNKNEFDIFAKELQSLGAEPYFVEYNESFNGMINPLPTKRIAYISGVEVRLLSNTSSNTILKKVAMLGSDESGNGDSPLSIPNGASSRAQFEIVRSHTGYIRKNGYTIFFNINLGIKR